MITNADMTIYNYWYNSDTGEKEYRGTQIQGIHWHTEQKVTVTEKGIVSEDVFKIRIPRNARIQAGRTFLEAKQYHLLSPEAVNGYWTVDIEDLFAKGLTDVRASSLSSLKRFAEAGKIISYSVNDFGMLPHIRIGGAA